MGKFRTLGILDFINVLILAELGVIGVCRTTAGMLSDRVDHPTQKTVRLMTFVLGLYSATIVLDPFMGSGTTGVACMQTGRRFIGIEIDPNRTMANCRERIRQAESQLLLGI